MQLSFHDVSSRLKCESLSTSGSIHGFSIDSRKVKPNDLFIAIRGDHHDGHDFLNMAKEHGASAALVSHFVPSVDLPQFVVSDPILAMGELAKAWRAHFSHPLIALTGSNGKTTTKNMIAAILAVEAGNRDDVLSTEGNLNNHLGVPLMLSRLNDSHRFAVIEMGMNHFNEIDYLTRIAQPNAVLITNAGPCHLQGVGSTIEGVAKAKAEIFSGLTENGIAILNRDDQFYSYWREHVSNHRVITFGVHPEADVRADYVPHQPMRLVTPLGECEIQLKLLGRHNVMNALAAAASVLPFSVSLSSIQAGLELLEPAKGRLNVHKLHEKTYLLDDTYNANPLSLGAALESMDLFSGKKVVVLGDLKELGENEIEIHTDLANVLKRFQVNYLFTFGKLTEHTAAMFGEGAFHFNDREKLISALKPLIQSDAVILVKGSRSMQMEKVVSALL